MMRIAQLPLAVLLFVVTIPVNHESAVAGQAPEVRLVSVFGGRGTEPGQFKFPLGMTVNSQDQIIIADAENNRMQICDHVGNCKTFGRFGMGAGKFINPHGVAVDSQDRIYTVETHNNRVQIFDAQGNWISMFGSNGSSLGQFRTPGDVAIDNQGRILIADEKNYRVQTCDESGQCTAFGTQGTAPGEFDWPRALVVDSEDTIIVTDRWNHRVQLCNEQGNCDVFGSQGSELGQFEGPVEVALDSQERIVIADRDNNRVQVCDRQGECWAFGSFGSEPGEFNWPLGVAVDSQDRIIVADNGNDRIQIFEVVSAFQIDAGLNGNWWSGPARNGEGAQIEISDGAGGSQTFVATLYSYFQGHQIFLVAVGIVSGSIADVDVFITQGGQWGAAYDPALVMETRWGSGIFTASSCDTMHMELTPNADFQGMGYTDLAYDLVRLTTPAVPCPLNPVHD